MIPNLYIAAAIAAASFGAGFAVNGWRLDAKVASCRADVTARDHALEIQGAAVIRLASASDSAKQEALEATKRATEAEARAKVAETPKRAAIRLGQGPETCLDAVAGWAGP